MRILLISSIAPAPIGGGQLVLYRHLVNRSEIELGLVLQEAWVGPEPVLFVQPSWFLRRLRMTRFGPRLQKFMDHFDGSLPVAPVDSFARRFRPDLIITVAHGDLYRHAMHASRRLGCPLVAFFHDWWPTAKQSPLLRRREEQRFRSLYRNCRVAFCVSEEMRAELGVHPCATVLLPIPSNAPFAAPFPPPPPAELFRIVYAGAIGGVYRQPLESLLGALAHHPRLRLQLWGDASGWEPQKIEELRRQGFYGGFLPSPDSPELQAACARAGALLTVLPFDAADRRLSFPSKLTEYSHHGRPLVVWGPPEAAGVRWLAHRNAGLVVTEPAAAKMVDALTTLRHDPTLWSRLAERAAFLARTDFSPELLQRTFIHHLAEACRFPFIQPGSRHSQHD